MVAGSIPGETRTVPLQIYQLLEAPGGIGKAQRIVVVSVLISAVALLVSEILVRREQRQLGVEQPQ